MISIIILVNALVLSGMLLALTIGVDAGNWPFALSFVAFAPLIVAWIIQDERGRNRRIELEFQREQELRTARYRAEMERMRDDEEHFARRVGR
jgi:membrane protein implicated in regulation of membrane protease activity